MVSTYTPDELPLLEAVGGVAGLGSLGSEVRSGVTARLRACTEVVLARKLMGYLAAVMEDEGLGKAFRSVVSIPKKNSPLLLLLQLSIINKICKQCEFIPYRQM